MKRHPASPDDQFAAFQEAMRFFPDFRPEPIADAGFDSWQHEGMHDPVGRLRQYARIEKRWNYVADRAGSGFTVQLEIHRPPGQERRTAVYLRSHGHPARSRNTANLTFKFAVDRVTGDYTVGIREKSTLARLRLGTSLPPWLRRSATPSRILLGIDIVPELVHRLLLLAEWAGRCRHGVSRPIEPECFFAPQPPGRKRIRGR